MPPLHVYAGPTAIDHLHKVPFVSNIFTQFLCPSGGPKWFVLAGLDKALFSSFFKPHCGHMNIIGSSSGAFRAACFAQSRPEEAIDRLANHYAKLVYSNKPSTYEVTQKAREMVYHIVPSQGVIDIMKHESFSLHFIAAKCKGISGSSSKFWQSLGLLGSAGLNRLNRHYLKVFFERTVFSIRKDIIRFQDPYNIPTSYIKMGFNSVHDALLASGSIPMVMDGIRDIVDEPDGIYRDGGVIDYHFDLNFNPAPGLTLYPHFNDFPSPGWFDKKNRSRLPHASTYDNVVMLVPSPSFVQSLPYGKIPDRQDFTTMDDSQRKRYWQTVLKESERLGDYFLELVAERKVLDVVKPLPFSCR